MTEPLTDIDHLVDPIAFVLAYGVITILVFGIWEYFELPLPWGVTLLGLSVLVALGVGRAVVE